MSDSQFRCEQCPKVFANRRNLVQHVRRNHRSQLFRCYHCKFVSKFKDVLQRHIVCHSKPHQPLRKKNFICPLCHLFNCEVRNEMIEHYVEVHEVPLSKRIVSFNNSQDFEKWKTDIERVDVCRFTVYSVKERNVFDIRYYRCFRDGIYDPIGKGKRRLKSKGSIRIGGICPASMKVVTNKETGVVEVTFIPNHVGHTEEVGRLNLTKVERAEIADKLGQNIPYQVILDQIRSSKRNELHRIHLTTRQDIANIQSTFKLGKVERGFLHTNDRTSVEAANESTVEPAKDIDYSNDLIITSDDNDSMERIIMDETSKKDVIGVPEINVNNRILKIREKFDEILKYLQTVEHADILWNALLPVIPTIKASSSTEVSNFVPASGQVKKVNVLQKMSPQKNFYSTNASKRLTDTYR